MYRRFYHLKYAPFATTSTSDGLFMTPRYKAALDHLLRGITARQGIMAFIGESGLGKTALLRAHLRQIDAQSVKTLYISNPNLAYDNSKVQFRDLIRSIYRELGLETEERQLSEMIRELHEIFIAEYKNGVNVVIVIDDAHFLSTEILKALPQLVEIFPYEENLVQVVLVGQPQLEKQLQATELRELEQRIQTVVKIHPFTAKESESYIQQQLAQASELDEPIFSKGALKQIVGYTRGVARDINILCTDVLIAGSQREKHPIPASIVRHVIAEFEPTRPSRFSRLGVLKVACLILVVGLSGSFLYNQFFHASPSASNPSPEAVTQVPPPLPPHRDEAPSSPRDEVAAPAPAASDNLAVELTERLKAFAPTTPPAAPPALQESRPPAPAAVDSGAAASTRPGVSAPPTPSSETPAPSASAPATAEDDAISRVETLIQQMFPGGGAFPLQVWGNKKREHVYVEGDKLLVHILAGSQAYLQVDYFQADGQVVHLLPHPLVSNRVQAGQTFTLGKADTLFQFNISPPFGDEMLMVMASQEPFEMRTGAVNVELASLYIDRLANRLRTYQAQGKGAVATLRIRTQKSHGTRLSQKASP